MDDRQMFTVDQVVERARQMQQQFIREATSGEVTGTAAGGLVTVTMLGTGEVSGIRIHQALFDEGDAERVAELILNAIRDATETVRRASQQRAEEMSTRMFGSLGVAGRPNR